MVIFKNTELNLDSALDKASRLIGKNRPIISLYKNPRYNDEPQFFQYTAVIKKIATLSSTHGDDEYLAGGTAISKEKALMKALGEAVERYCLAFFRKNQFIYASVNELRQEYLDPSIVVNFSAKQLKNKNLNSFQQRSNSKFWWSKGFSITNNKEILVPAQLVYVPYHSHQEPVIRLSITTGAASGTSLEGAIKRGICEIVERDSFMIFYLNKLTPPRLDLSKTSDETLVKIQKSFTRYKLDLFIFDISTDLPSVSIMAVIIDKTGIGPAVSVGLKCSLSVKDTIVGAIEEAQQVRSWIRDELYNQKKFTKPNLMMGLKERGLYWSRPERIKDLDFFLNSKNIILVDEFVKVRSRNEDLKFNVLINKLKGKKVDVVFVDVTRPEVKKTGFFVAKVIIPQLHPVYLYEDFKYLGGRRLYQVPKVLGYKNTPKSEKELNSKPHPFL